jgi:hypothetical protein
MSPELMTLMYLNKTPKSRFFDMVRQGQQTSDVRRPTFDVLVLNLMSRCPDDVPVLRWHPTEDSVLIGGLMNGQIVIWDLQDWKKASSQAGGYPHAAPYKKCLHFFLLKHGVVIAHRQKSYVNPLLCSLIFIYS